jgi:hypothetical protein
MVKFIFFLLIIFSNIYASEFDEKCLNCHQDSFQFNMMMKRYTLKYSSEEKIKEAIFNYLKNPTHETSILPLGFLNRFGIKDKSTLDDETLKEMIAIYYDRYNLKSKLY